MNTFIQQPADRLVKTPEQLLEGLVPTAHHCCKHGVLVGGDRGAFDVSNASNRDVTGIFE
jgi:hypothetical protein